jgi:hypothetical protein
MLRSFILLLALGVSGGTAAQEAHPIADAGTITCDFPQPEDNIGKWVTSASGFSTAVELLASVNGIADKRRCVTSWILHWKDKEGKSFAVTVAQREDRPEDNEWIQENSFEINAFSSNGHLILVSQIEAQGDWDKTTPIVFDLKSGAKWRVELYPLFKQLIPAECYVVYRVLRFTGSGNVLISAMSTESDRGAGEKPCFSTSLWELDYRDNKIKPAAPLTKMHN